LRGDDFEATTVDATDVTATLDFTDTDDDVDDVSNEVAALDDVNDDGGDGAGFLGGEISLLNALSTECPVAVTADGDDDTSDDDVTTTLTDDRAGELVVAGTDGMPVFADFFNDRSGVGN
jgi:hypothetical protein